ncbi:MAG: Rpn family recombination-promoting nuclease/putative transposase, partial [Ruminococcus sp.]|nr:Rpn family recombination-promoting nuclease/putative transposase [Ruminococcus sp.]
MVIRDKDLLGTFEQKKALVAQFNLMDDTFFSVVMGHNDAAEYLLSKLLGKNVKIIENKTQYSIRNAESHSIVLDALVEDEEHNIYDVEVQVGDKDNHERRIRYYRTAIDWSYLEKGKDYSELPEVYMIFISDFDPFDMK